MALLPPACGVKVVEKPFVQGGTHTHTHTDVQRAFFGEEMKSKAQHIPNQAQMRFAQAILCQTEAALKQLHRTPCEP